MEKPKISLGLIMDKLFRRTFFLKPQQDRTLEAIDITGYTEQYLKDKTGATSIDPSCIMRVRGLKRVDYIALKLSSATSLLNLFDSQKVAIEPPSIESHKIKVHVPDEYKILKVPDVNITLPERNTVCPSCNAVHTIPAENAMINIGELPHDIPDFEVEVPKIDVPKIEVSVPNDSQMNEKIFGDMLNYAEISGRMQAEKNPEVDKKMNMILLLAGAAVLVGVFIFFKMKSAGG